MPAPPQSRVLPIHVQCSDTDLVARLLQALRWRLQKTPAGPDRQRVLATYIESDLLHGQNPSDRGSVLEVRGLPGSWLAATTLVRIGRLVRLSGKGAGCGVGYLCGE